MRRENEGIQSSLSRIMELADHIFDVVLELRYKDGIETIDAAFSTFNDQSEADLIELLQNYAYELQTTANKYFKKERIKDYFTKLMTRDGGIPACKITAHYILVVLGKYLQMQTVLYVDKKDDECLINCYEKFNQTYSDIFSAFKDVTGEELKISDQTVENSKKAMDLTMVVISSTGGVAQYHGGFLGQYEYDNDNGYYTQTSTALGKTLRRYLYRDEDDLWWVGLTPGKKNGWIRNLTPSKKSPPRKGWQWTDGKTSYWYPDITLMISPGQLPSLPDEFMVRLSDTKAESKKFQDGLGLYTKTERWWLGKPVYYNTKGWRLCQGPGDYGWMIGPALGGAVLRGSRSHDSPVSERNWRYWAGNWSKSWNPAKVMVTQIQAPSQD